MPILRPFRALRYSAQVAPDLGAVLCPPYDVISPAERERLVARDPHNAVRLELPEPAPGGPPESKYREATRTFLAWRTGGVLAKDAVPSVYVYEQRYTLQGTDVARRQRGFFVRLKLEPFSPDGGVRPHERTLSGPKADRYALLKATGANFSAIAGLYRGEPGVTAAAMDAVMRGAADASGTDDAGVEHRLWVVPAGDGEPSPEREAGNALLAAASAGPITIADGHHRYETALAYREERGRNRACESDPGYDYVMTLVYDIEDEPLTVLPTHRLVHGGPTGAALLEALGAELEVSRVDSREALLSALRDGGASVSDPAGSGRFGVWSAGVGAVARVRPESVAADAPLSARLDVAHLGRVLERVLGIGPSEVAGGGRLSYSHDAREAVAAVDAGEAESVFLLDPTPVEAVLEVAAAGDVMPQKSTFFYPKAACGLVFGPLEW